MSGESRVLDLTVLAVGLCLGGSAAAQCGNSKAGSCEVIFSTGGSRPILSNGTLTNLGLSSGYLNATFPQRWIAAPFTVPAPPAAGDAWLIRTIAANGFIPGGSVNETMEWIIWERDAATNAAPVDGDQVVSGSVPFPTPIDDPTGDPADEQHNITTDFVLAPGDYYLTVYAANTTGEAANFAWFCNAPDGIDLVDSQGPFCWRSATQPEPGFQRYTLPAQFQQQAGLDPNQIHNVAFQILGVQVPTTDCDFNGSLDVDDLAAGATDCNANALLDACEFGAIAHISPFGSGSPLWHLFDAVNFSTSDVTVRIEFLGDFDGLTEFATLSIDGQNFGAFGVLNGPGCLDSAAAFDVTIPADTFNQLAADGQLEVLLEPSTTASPDECAHSFARLVVPTRLVAPDCDGNGQSDSCDIASGILEDCDHNGLPDDCDTTFADCNANGRPDTCDLADGILADCDGNGVPDSCDALFPDCNGNGRPDSCDLLDGTLTDCDGNGVPDLCDTGFPDCNANGRPDLCDLADGILEDCDGNGVADPCDTGFPDCNNNGRPDACDLADGKLFDCDGNDVPDGCDTSFPDCNGNGRPDVCDLADGTLEDCDGNGVPDLCDTSFPDCNGNGRPDVCELAEGTLEDCDGDGAPDLCDIFGDSTLDCDGDERLDACQIAETPGLDKNSDGVLDSCSLAFGDFNLDGIVDNTDLAVLLSIWGQVNSPIGDLNGDGIVDGEDLGILLIHWGPAF